MFFQVNVTYNTYYMLLRCSLSHRLTDVNYDFSRVETQTSLRQLIEWLCIECLVIKTSTDIILIPLKYNRKCTIYSIPFATFTLDLQNIYILTVIQELLGEAFLFSS